MLDIRRTSPTCAQVRTNSPDVCTSSPRKQNIAQILKAARYNRCAPHGVLRHELRGINYLLILFVKCQQLFPHVVALQNVLVACKRKATRRRSQTSHAGFCPSTSSPRAFFGDRLGTANSITRPFSVFRCPALTIQV